MSFLQAFMANNLTSLNFVKQLAIKFNLINGLPTLVVNYKFK